ncbi:MAG: porin family protein [Alphaproteobacteria bacterium]|nr:porin family protein [Alphaproteobacteria bacterium]
MRKIIGTVTLGLLITASSGAWAGEKGSFYLRGDVGAAQIGGNKGVIGDLGNPPDEVDFNKEVTPNAQVGVGYYFADTFRLEAIAGNNFKRQISGDYTNDGSPIANDGQVDVESLYGLIAVSADLQAAFGIQDTPWMPYVSAGAGVSRNKLGQFDFSPSLGQYIVGNSNTSLAWTIGLGTGYRINQQWVFDVGYRYMDLGKAMSSKSSNVETLRSPLEFDVTSHVLNVGVRYEF